MQLVEWVVQFLSGLALLLGLPGPLGEALVAVLLVLGIVLPCYLAYRSLHAASVTAGEAEEVIAVAGGGVSIFSQFRDVSSEYYPEVQAIASLEKQICQHARDAIQKAAREGKISGAIASRALELYLRRMRSADELTSALRLDELREEIRESVAETAARISEVEERAAPAPAPPAPPAPVEEAPAPSEGESAVPVPGPEEMIPTVPEEMEEGGEEVEAAADTLLEALQATEAALSEGEEAAAPPTEPFMPSPGPEEPAAPIPAREEPVAPEVAPPAEPEADLVMPEEQPSPEAALDMSAVRRAMLDELTKIKEALEKEE